MLKYLFTHLLVWKIDRISRNLLDFASMYNELKDAINDLTEMLDGMIIVDENTNNTTNIKVDGKTIATATAPYFNAKMVKDASKAKSKTATSKM